MITRKEVIEELNDRNITYHCQLKKYNSNSLEISDESCNYKFYFNDKNMLIKIVRSSWTDCCEFDHVPNNWYISDILDFFEKSNSLG